MLYRPFTFKVLRNEIFCFCIAGIWNIYLKANVDYEKEIEKILNSMTVEEKVGQIMMVEISHISPEEVKEYSIGAILNGGGSFPYGKKNHDVEDWRKAC